MPQITRKDIEAIVMIILLVVISAGWILFSCYKGFDDKYYAEGD